jgi:hypothetical protein
MKIALKDYMGRMKVVEFSMDNLRMAIINVLSGDEVLGLYYDGGKTLDFDSSDCRIHDNYDGDRIVYSTDLGIDLFAEYAERLNHNESEVANGSR